MPKEQRGRRDKMKVNKDKYFECVEYLKEINDCKIDDLDFSEFSKVDKELIEDWKFTGLNNTNFIDIVLDN